MHRMRLNEAAKTIADAESQGLALIVRGNTFASFFLYSPRAFMDALAGSALTDADVRWFLIDSLPPVHAYQVSVVAAGVELVRARAAV